MINKQTIHQHDAEGISYFTLIKSRGLNIHEQVRSKHQGSPAGTTAVQTPHQGTIRHRAVSDGGALFGSFLGKQKGTYTCTSQ